MNWILRLTRRSPRVRQAAALDGHKSVAGTSARSPGAMGCEALQRKPWTPIPAREAAIYPYFLANCLIDRPNQRWSSEITDRARNSPVRSGPRPENGATPVCGREANYFLSTPGIWLYIVGEREVDGARRPVFALHEQMHHGAGLAPEDVTDLAQRERRGSVDRSDHIAFR